MATTNKYLTLFQLSGWYKSSPINLTQEEISKKVSLGGNNSGRNNHTSQSFDAYLQASSNPMQRQSDMAAMAESDIVRPLIEVYVEECAQPDINEGKTVWFECNDSSVEEDLNKMLERILVEDNIAQIAKHVAGRGNAFRRVLYNDEEGVVGFVEIENREMERLFDPLSRRLLGFRWSGQKPAQPVFDDDSVFAPWEFVHFRSTNMKDEYGEAALAHLYPLYKRILLSMNQMTLYRISTMPNRTAILLDSGDVDFTTGMEQASRVADLIRQKQMVSMRDFQARYDTPALDSILVLPIRKDETTKIEKIEGDKDVPDVHDLEYLSKNLYGGARIPKAYVGHGDDGGNGLAKASLVSQDIRFARMIRNLRRPLVIGFYQLACIHLAIKGKDPKDFDIKVKMSKISALEEEVNAATLETQVNLASSLTSLCKDLEIPNQEIIELVFREYLHVPRKFVDVVKLATKVQQALNGGGEGGEGSSSGMFSSMGGGGGLGGMDDFGDSDVDMDMTLDDAKADEAGSGPKGPQSLNDSTQIENRYKDRLLESALSDIKKKCRALNESKDESDNFGKIALTKRSISSTVSDLISIGISKKCSLVEDAEWKPARIAPDIYLPNSDVNFKKISLTESVNADVHPTAAVVRKARKRKHGSK